jgi:hypothetical protein
MQKMSIILLLSVITVTGVGGRAASAAEDPALVIPGAGFTGAWDTEVVIGNPFDTPMNVGVSPVRLSSQFAGCQADPCPPPFEVDVAIPAHAQRVVHYSDIFVGVAALYVSNTDPGATQLPVVRARAYAVAQPSRAMELPVVTYATLVARGGAPMVFVGALRSADGAHSNLAIAETANLVGSDAIVRIDAIDENGQTVATMNRSIIPAHVLFLTDILEQMGVSEFSGQIRVTQTGGTGVLDGALATLTPDGGFAVSSGFNP